MRFEYTVCDDTLHVLDYPYHDVKCTCLDWPCKIHRIAQVTHTCKNILDYVTQGLIQDFLEGGHGPVLGGVDLRRGCCLVKMCVKTKELDPAGGVCQKVLCVHAPMQLITYLGDQDKHTVACMSKILTKPFFHYHSHSCTFY